MFVLHCDGVMCKSHAHQPHDLTLLLVVLLLLRQLEHMFFLMCICATFLQTLSHFPAVANLCHAVKIVWKHLSRI